MFKGVMMDIEFFINEVTEEYLKEITINPNAPTYEYYDDGDGSFIVRIDEPRNEKKNRNAIQANFEVTFDEEGEEGDKLFDISFRKVGGNYTDDTGMGVQFKLLSTISKIVREQVNKYQPNIISFKPAKSSGEVGNRRLKLYMNYVNAGAGEDFDTFILGKSEFVNIEKRTPSFLIENGYQDPDKIQKFVTQLTLYGGYYHTDLPSRDPNIVSYRAVENVFLERRGRNERTTRSARRFVDWILSSPNLIYSHGQNEPEDTSSQPETSDDSFDKYLQSEISNSKYSALEPYLESLMGIQDIIALRDRAKNAIADGVGDKSKLDDIIRASDDLIGIYNASNTNKILNEVEGKLNELLNI